MQRWLAVVLLLTGTWLQAKEPEEFRLGAPSGWGGESIQLPPGFARDMKWKGTEHIRFAPGMMQAESDTFFCYAFVFELQPASELTEAAIRAEFLKYYRGLCQAVLNGKRPDVDPTKFTLELKLQKPEGESAEGVNNFTGVLDWVEPFATQKPQKLNLEIRTWTKGDRPFLFACVSPQPRDAAIWKKLHTIRDDYLKKP
jgi:hypothetical protein